MQGLPLNYHEWREAAQRSVTPPIFGYYAGGATDEITLRENHRALDRLAVVPRVMRDVSAVDPSVRVIGGKFRSATPILVAPTGFQGMAHADGELASVRAAVKEDTIFTLSTMSNHTMEEVSQAAYAVNPDAVLFFQLYVQRKRDITVQMVERAEKCGFRALVLTVDVPVMGRRERDLKQGFKIPEHLSFANFASNITDSTRNASVQGNKNIMRAISDMFDASLEWKDVAWLKSITSLPVLVKGVLHPDDVDCAIDAGVDGIIVSNHGARQLDTIPAAIDALPAIVQRANGRVEIFMDGGIRRGTDAIKALALGATAVFIGRANLWGLCTAGEEGCRAVLAQLKLEFEDGMKLVGARNVGEIDRSMVALHGSGLARARL